MLWRSESAEGLVLGIVMVMVTQMPKVKAVADVAGVSLLDGFSPIKAIDGRPLLQAGWSFKALMCS